MGVFRIGVGVGTGVLRIGVGVGERIVVPNSSSSTINGFTLPSVDSNNCLNLNLFMINFIYKYIRTIKKNKEGAGGGQNEKNFSRKKTTPTINKKPHSY
jgi:hypothetical protein